MLSLIEAYKEKRKYAVLFYKLNLKSKKIYKLIQKTENPKIIKNNYKKQKKTILYCEKEKQSLIEKLELLGQNEHIKLEFCIYKLRTMKIKSLEDCDEFSQLYSHTAQLLLRVSKVIFIPVTKAPFYLNIMEFLGLCAILLIMVKLSFMK